MYRLKKGKSLIGYIISKIYIGELENSPLQNSRVV